VARLVRDPGCGEARQRGALKGCISMAPGFDVLPDDVDEALGMQR
jgi:hypothetical protein